MCLDLEEGEESANSGCAEGLVHQFALTASEITVTSEGDLEDEDVISLSVIIAATRGGGRSMSTCGRT